MLKQLFLAPAASGKTDATIQLARETSVSVHEVRICVPTGLQARAWQSRLAAAGGALGIHVLGVFAQPLEKCQSRKRTCE